MLASNSSLRQSNSDPTLALHSSQLPSQVGLRYPLPLVLLLRVPRLRAAQDAIEYEEGKRARQMRRSAVHHGHGHQRPLGRRLQAVQELDQEGVLVPQRSRGSVLVEGFPQLRSQK